MLAYLWPWPAINNARPPAVIQVSYTLSIAGEGDFPEYLLKLDNSFKNLLCNIAPSKISKTPDTEDA